MNTILDTGVLGQLILNNSLEEYTQLKKELLDGSVKGWILNPIILECAYHLADIYNRNLTLTIIDSVIHTYNLQIINEDIPVLVRAGRLKRRYPHLSLCDSLILAFGLQKMEKFCIHTTDSEMIKNLDQIDKNQIIYKIYRFDEEGKGKK